MLVPRAIRVKRARKAIRGNPAKEDRWALPE
jgi:hypothetical protein